MRNLINITKPFPKIFNSTLNFQILLLLSFTIFKIIIANYKELLWAHSFPLGNAVLYEKFHKSDPISGMEIKQIEEYLVSQLQILIHHLKKYSIN